MIKHSQSTQSNKFATSLHQYLYLKKEFKDGVHFLHADKHQSWHYCFDGSDQACAKYAK